jgi:transcriptional regulator with XRE-family HTH domain
MTASGETHQVFARMLRRYREAAALTQEDLAERSGLTSRAISDMERGRTAKPYYRSVRLLADALELTAPSRERLIDAARGGTGLAGQPDPVRACSRSGSSDWRVLAAEGRSAPIHRSGRDLLVEPVEDAFAADAGGGGLAV